MIYYPLSVLMNVDIRDILIISTPQVVSRTEELLKDGSEYSIDLAYALIVFNLCYIIKVYN